jgi:hypothetical protein
MMTIPFCTSPSSLAGLINPAKDDGLVQNDIVIISLILPKMMD